MTINDKYKEMRSEGEEPMEAQTEPSQAEEPVINLHTTQHPRSPKAWWLVVLLLAALLIAAMLSCPKAEDHQTAIKETTKAAVNMVVNDLGGSAPMANFLVSSLAETLVTPMITGQAEYHDYVLFSTSSLYLDGEDHTVSVGLYGHVFTISKNRLADYLRSSLSDLVK